MSSFELCKIVDATGWALFHSVWQSTILGVIVWILFRFISKDNAKLRYGVASIGLSFILLSFIATLSHYYSISYKPNTESNLSPEMLLLLLKQESEIIRSVNFDKINISKHLPLLVNIWFLGVCILSLKMTFDYLNSIRLRKHLTYPLSDKNQNIALNLIQRFNIKREITFKESGYVQVPSLVGYFKPVVLLPVCMLSGIPNNQLEIIIAHELAHIKRHDYLFQFIQGILELLFFYHPVVWWLSSVVNTEREHICDDLAVKVCGESLTLIKALNNMEAIRKKRFDLVLGFSGKKDNLFNRIQRIIRPKQEPKSRTNRLVFSGLFVFLFIGLILVSNFAISENSHSGKQFFSKINIVDQNLNQKIDNDAIQEENIHKKKSTQIEKGIKNDETISKAKLKTSAAELKTVTQQVTEIELPKDSLKSKEWIDIKVSELIEEQKTALNEAAIELENVKLDMDFESMQMELKKALDELNPEQIKKEIKEQHNELMKDLQELTSEDFKNQMQWEKNYELEEINSKLDEIKLNSKLSEKEKEEIRKSIKETLEKVNSNDFKKQIEDNLKKAEQALKDQIHKIESGELESQLKSQRELIKKQLEKFNSPEYQNELREKLEKSKESIKNQLNQINTPEYREQLKKDLNTNKDTVLNYHQNTIFQSLRIHSKDPLYLLDGKKLTHNELNRINPNSIESISVLKDKSALAIYGLEGKNGVVQITSKKAIHDKPISLQMEKFSGKDSILYVINGEMVNTKSLNKINSNDINSINVIKDKKAIDKYGQKGKHGVIEITLKK